MEGLESEIANKKVGKKEARQAVQDKGALLPASMNGSEARNLQRKDESRLNAEE